MAGLASPGCMREDLGAVRNEVALREALRRQIIVSAGVVRFERVDVQPANAVAPLPVVQQQVEVLLITSTLQRRPLGAAAALIRALALRRRHTVSTSDVLLIPFCAECARWIHLA